MAEETEEKKTEEKPKDEVSITQVVQALQYMAKQQGDMRNLFTEFQTSVNEKLAMGNQQEHEETREEVDVDSMSNTELMGTFKTMIQDALKPVTEGIQTSAETQNKESAEKEVTRLREEYGDFDGLADHTKEVLKANPSMNIEDAYRLAKVKNPETVTAIEKKQEEENPKEKEAPEQDVMFGLLPTSSNVSRNDRMTKKSAVTSAWDEVVVPHLGGAGDLSSLH